MIEREQMRRIIDVDEKLVCEGFERNFTEEERDILIRAIGNSTPVSNEEYDEGFNAGYAAAIKNISEYRKLADKLQRPHGEWIFGKSDSGDYLKCPKCNFIEWQNLVANFCSNCGTRMVTRGEKNEK